MNIKPYLIIPKFIEQPTWGGTYISGFKNWQDKPFANKKIGQSYELYSQTLLTNIPDSNDPTFEPELDVAPRHSFAIDELIGVDPEKVLGINSIKKFGEKVNTLIKFTQAKGNSFQVHVKEGTENTSWLPKPESWYYFEEGLATLGLSDVKKIEEYNASATRIAAEMDRISSAIKSGQLLLDEAKKQAANLIIQENIYQYVNTVVVPKDAVIDIHAGGIHHSWEENDAKYPNGNIVYEVQLEAMDDASTLRSFDKGKIKDDGSVRPVQVEEYFTYIDASEKTNNPQTFLSHGKKLTETVTELFNTPYYQLHQTVLTGTRDMKASNSFQHIFVHDGTVIIESEQNKLTVGRGHSAFIPASCDYRLTSLNTPAILLTTFI